MTFPEVSTQFIIPIGAVLAAGITAMVSFVNLVVSKEQKVSDFRQAWIDALREELAEFASHARRLAAEVSPIDLKRFTGSTIAQIEAHNQEVLRPDPYHENRQRMAQAYYAVRLRLNPSEPDHSAILQSMDGVYEGLTSNTEAVRFERTVAALNGLACASQGVLKREWTRVKGGEPKYRRAVMLATAVGIIFGAMLFVIVVYATYREI